MLHPAQKIASFFVAKKLIPAQDYEWAVYGLQRRLLAAVFYPILFLIGLLVSDVYSTVLFFVVFTSLRHRVGGHHAGSAIRCLINSSLIVLCGLFLYPQITAGWPVVGHSLVGMIACLVIGLAGPCNDPHIAMTPAEPYAENSNPPTLQDTLQEILDNPTYSNAYKEAAKKKCDYLMSVRDSGPSALTRASNSMTIYVPHTRQPNGVSCGPSTVRQTLAHYGLVKNLSTIMSEMSDASKPATYCYSPTNGIFEISKMFYYINTSLYGEGGDPTGVVYMALWKNGAYTSSQQMLNMMASVISNNNPPILHTGAIQGTKRTSYNDTSKWPINISSGHFMSVSGYNLSNATIQVTDPDVTNQQSSSSYSSGKYYINSSVVYSTCDYFAA